MIIHIINIIIFSALIISSILTGTGLLCVLFNQEHFDYFVNSVGPDPDDRRNENPKDATIRSLAKLVIWDEFLLTIFWILGLIVNISTM